MTLTPTQNPWPSADFFPGEDKKILFALKTPKRYYFLENILFCPTKVGGDGRGQMPLFKVSPVCADDMALSAQLESRKNIDSLKQLV
jgi:hypothetical protein